MQSSKACWKLLLKFRNKYKLTMFNDKGLPVRAFVDLTLEEIDLSSKK